MSADSIIRKARALCAPFRVASGRKFTLRDHDPRETLEWKAGDKSKAKRALAEGVELLSELQEKLYAQDHWAVLLIFQAMDAAGKDGVIKHVMSGINPQGCQVVSFKAPTDGELDHDYLWRCNQHLPNRGNIGIFNRSYYEETLVVRVHPHFLTRQKLPPHLVTKRIWKERFEDIRAFERYLSRNGTLVRKFFLHVSPEEQKQRFLERIDNPEKNWKFNAADVAERAHWKRYMEAYEQAIAQTATAEAPWFIVPADNKWFTRLVVASAVIDTLASLPLAYPDVSSEKRRELMEARATLLNEDPESQEPT